ncbi:MAG: hypothetical protein ABFD92_16460 [Planctomycetaceae bacterium]
MILPLSGGVGGGIGGRCIIGRAIGDCGAAWRVWRGLGGDNCCAGIVGPCRPQRGGLGLGVGVVGVQLGQGVQRQGGIGDGDAAVALHRQSRVAVAGQFHHHAGRHGGPADRRHESMPEAVEVQHQPRRIAGLEEVAIFCPRLPLIGADTLIGNPGGAGVGHVFVQHLARLVGQGKRAGGVGRRQIFAQGFRHVRR